MNIIVVDDRQLLVNMLLRILKGIDPEYNCVGMTKTTEAEEYVKKNPVDVAFLDVEMGPKNGIELAKTLSEYCPRVNIIFVTGHKEYAMDAYGVYPSGYLLKPVSEKDVRDALSKLRYPVDVEQPKEAKRLRVQCFGEFEVFCDGKPLRFKRSKSKELFAYLICVRGSSVNMATVASVLWEDSDDNPSEKAIGSMCRNLIADIQSTLNEKGLDNVLIKEWKSVSLNVDAIDCDWYDYIKRNKGDLRYPGDFVVGYSWAEYMIPRY